MNYGGLGNFIGHEFTHAFDDEGSQYDEEGNLVNWWDSKTQKEYHKRAKCIVDQYSSYLVPEVGSNVSSRKFYMFVRSLNCTILHVYNLIYNE